MKIAIMESLGISAKEMAAHKAPFEAVGHEFCEYSRSNDLDTLITQAKDADVMILANMPMPDAVIAACPCLRFIDVAFTGVDHVGLQAAREKKITVSNASGYSDQSVAELALGMALSLCRNLGAVEARCRAGQTKDGLVGCELQGKTVGIIGLGHIGTRSAELFHGLGCSILAHSRTRHTNAPEYVRQTDLDELLKTSDVVLLHCPLNDSTRGLLTAARLSQMKSTAFLINVARGPVVDTIALAEALNAGQIAGAAVDVFDTEPPLPPEEPLLHAHNCLVTPHVAFATRESMTRRAGIVFENLAAWLEGRPQNVIL